MTVSSSSRHKSTQQKYKVIIRTTAGGHSAVIAGAMAGSVVARIGSIAVDELWASIKYAHKMKHDRNELQLSLFGEARNADFIIGAVFPEDEGGPWAECDIKGAAKMVAALKGIFADVADVEEIDMDEADAQSLDEHLSVDPKRNHIFFCMRNPFVEWILGRGEAPIAADDLRQDRARFALHYNDEQLPDEQWCFRSKEQVLRPIFNSNLVDPGTGKAGVYDQDYLMILKIPTIFKREREGVDFVIGGCHGCGTGGIGLVLEDVNILRQIKEKIGSNQFFQAIIKVNAGLRTATALASLRDRFGPFLKKSKDHRDFYAMKKILEPTSVEFIDAIPLQFPPSS